jgi:hypothetical protein
MIMKPLVSSVVLNPAGVVLTEKIEEERDIFRAEWAATQPASLLPWISGPELYVGLSRIGPNLNTSILKPVFSF